MLRLTAEQTPAEEMEELKSFSFVLLLPAAPLQPDE